MTGFPWRGCVAGTIGVVCPDNGRAHDAWIADALGGRAGRSVRRIGQGRPGQLGHRWSGRGAATEGGSGQQRAERPRQRAAARPGPCLADDPHPTEGDPYRQRPTRTDSAGVGTGAGRRLSDVQRHGGQGATVAQAQTGRGPGPRVRGTATPATRPRGRLESARPLSAILRRNQGAGGAGEPAQRGPRKGPGKPAHLGGAASSQCRGLGLVLCSWGF